MWLQANRVGRRLEVTELWLLFHRMWPFPCWQTLQPQQRLVAVAANLQGARPANYTLRAPATQERVATLTREHDAANRRYEKLSMMAMAMGQPLPPAPAPLDLSAAF